MCSFDASQGACNCLLTVLCGCTEDAYQTRWHTCSQARCRLSFHCHMEDRWEDNLRRTKQHYSMENYVKFQMLHWISLKLSPHIWGKLRIIMVTYALRLHISSQFTTNVLSWKDHFYCLVSFTLRPIGLQQLFCSHNHWRKFLLFFCLHRSNCGQM